MSTVKKSSRIHVEVVFGNGPFCQKFITAYAHHGYGRKAEPVVNEEGFSLRSEIFSDTWTRATRDNIEAEFHEILVELFTQMGTFPARERTTNTKSCWLSQSFEDIDELERALRALRVDVEWGY